MSRVLDVVLDLLVQTKSVAINALEVGTQNFAGKPIEFRRALLKLTLKDLISENERRFLSAKTEEISIVNDEIFSVHFTLDSGK